MIDYFLKKKTQLETSQKRNRNRNKVQYIDFTSPLRENSWGVFRENKQKKKKQVTIIFSILNVFVLKTNLISN